MLLLRRVAALARCAAARRRRLGSAIPEWAPGATMACGRPGAACAACCGVGGGARAVGGGRFDGVKVAFLRAATTSGSSSRSAGRPACSRWARGSELARPHAGNTAPARRRPPGRRRLIRGEVDRRGAAAAGKAPRAASAAPADVLEARAVPAVAIEERREQVAELEQWRALHGVRSSDELAIFLRGRTCRRRRCTRRPPTASSASSARRARSRAPTRPPRGCSLGRGRARATCRGRPALRPRKGARARRSSRGQSRRA